MNTNKELTNRFNQLLEIKGFTIYKVSKDTNISTSVLDGLSTGNTKKPQRKTIEILSEYFGVHLNWLYKGEGEMLKSDTKNESKCTTCEQSYSTLLLPLTAQGGSLTDFQASISEYDCETIISPIKDADFAITVTGDSMSPEYPSGSKILIKKIDPDIFINWGNVFVLDTANGQILKKVSPTKDEGVVLCESINEKYPPFTVRMENVFGMYRVLMLMSLK